MKTSQNLKNTKRSKLGKLIKFDTSFEMPIIGTDEAGRGPAAGPVYAAAVYFPEYTKELKKTLKYLDDSKKLNEKIRKELSVEIMEQSVYSIQYSTVAEIEKINILQASLLAMKKSCIEVEKQLDIEMSVKILVDGKFIIPNYNIEQDFVIKGDSKSISIAAASVLAKVARDEYMQKFAEEYPQYLWYKNKGYLTKEHIEAIKKHGPVEEHHRMSFLTGILQGKLF